MNLLVTQGTVAVPHHLPKVEWSFLPGRFCVKRIAQIFLANTLHLCTNVPLQKRNLKSKLRIHQGLAMWGMDGDQTLQTLVVFSSRSAISVCLLEEHLGFQLDPPELN